MGASFNELRCVFQGTFILKHAGLLDNWGIRNIMGINLQDALFPLSHHAGINYGSHIIDHYSLSIMCGNIN